VIAFVLLGHSRTENPAGTSEFLKSGERFLVSKYERLMNFAFRWRHQDGSVVEFTMAGWRSDDPRKASWLSRMNQLYSLSPAIPPVVRNWLQLECELVEFTEGEAHSR
jgi:hypothetical protein